MLVIVAVLMILAVLLVVVVEVRVKRDHIHMKCLLYSEYLIKVTSLFIDKTMRVKDVK